MKLYRAKANIHTLQGRIVPPGDVLALTDEDAARMVAEGTAEFVEETKAQAPEAAAPPAEQAAEPVPPPLYKPPTSKGK